MGGHRGTIDASAMAAILRCICIAGTMCASFGAFGSWLLLLAWSTAENGEAPYGGLAIRAVGLTALTVVFAIATLFAQKPPPAEAEESDEHSSWKDKAVLIVCVGIFLVPFLGNSPRPEPDELHHLIVARNIAEHGVYGSGHPDTGYIEFDQYDSVGAPVILPVATAFKLAGSSIASGRFVMAIFGIALIVVVFTLAERRYGLEAATLAAIFTLYAPMTIYLGRTLYGEVPALLFFVLGAACWGRGLEDRKALWFGAAGVLLGLSILSKTFMVLAAWPFAAATFYVAIQQLRIPWKAILIPPLGVVFIVGLWSVYESTQAHDVSDSTAMTIFEYQHFLLFGIEPLADTLRWWLLHPFFTIAALFGYGWAATKLFSKWQNPAMLVIMLFGVLVIFWWLFYSTGRTPRYLWYACAIGGMFAGMALVTPHKRAQDSKRYLVLVLIVAFEFLSNGSNEFQLMHMTDQMKDDRALAEWMAEQPEDVRMATAFWPIQRLGNFAAGRAVGLARAGDEWDVLLWKRGTVAEVDLPSEENIVAEFGPYVAFEARSE